MRGFLDAYLRLKWAQDNPPSAEDLERLAEERKREDRERKIARLRKGVA